MTGYTSTCRPRRGTAPVARHERDDRGEVAAGAVAADREPGGVTAELGRVLAKPRDDRVRVLHAGREPVLGRETVVDRDDDAAGRVADRAAHAVVGVEVADHPPAAVEERDDGRRTAGGG